MPLILDNSSLTLSSLSLEYVKVRVSGRRAGVDLVPTGFTVDFAFTAAATPATEPGVSDWKVGSWETDASSTPTRYFARCLIGPSGTATLTDGSYDVWVRVADGTETPVRRVGRIIVT